MSGIFEEIKAVRGYIADERESLYCLETALKDNPRGIYDISENRKRIEDTLARRQVTIRALELYEKSLESTVNTAARRESREKSCLHNENPTE